MVKNLLPRTLEKYLIVTPLGLLLAGLALALAPRLSPNVRLLAQGGCVTNPIACENQLAGNPASEWSESGAGDPSIQGFTTNISVNHGETVTFKVLTNASQYRIDIYRLGYYGGLGARKVATVLPLPTLPQSQPPCLTEASTGLVDCGNWAVSATWNVPAAAVSGMYLARLVRLDTLGASHIPFVVRDDEGHSDLLFQTSDTTWLAFNDYQGSSLNPAVGNSARKVSYNRPFVTRGTANARVAETDYPMLRWLEANGYSVSYTTGVDTDRRGTELLEHKVFLSVGHDEYWSAGQRANVEAARDAGVHLAFFSGNAVASKIRWENSLSTPSTSYRTMVYYNETEAGAKIDPTTTWTGTWRDPRFSPPADGGRPENALRGTMFMGDCCAAFPLTVSAAQGKARFWRNTPLATMPGSQTTFAQGIVGYEFDGDVDNDLRPKGLVRLSASTISYANTLLDYGATFGPGNITHALTLHRNASGALVFSAGTTRWGWALDTTHEPDAATPNILLTTEPIIQQATVNLLADMHSQPATLRPGLTAASASSDTFSPVTTITSPAPGQPVSAEAVLTIAGTASDIGGGQVSAVEVSTDGGATWHPAVGTTAWTFAWTVSGSGTVTIKSRGTDDSGNTEIPSAGVPVDVGPRACPCSVWTNATVPPPPHDEGDSSAVEIGMKFRADVAGTINGVRFYKVPGNNGTHTGHLWTTDGTLLGTATFTGETATGWQQATFPSPIAVTANTTYVVSYHAPSGHYAGTVPFFTSDGVDHAPLHALSTPASGGNGVFVYSATPAFPNLTWSDENYWVDVVFNHEPDTVPPSITGRTPAPGQTLVAVNTAVTATFSEVMTPATIAGASFDLRTPANAVVPATVTYSHVTKTATLQPSAALSENTTYTATVRGGVTGVKDLNGIPMTGNVSWVFTTLETTAPTVTGIAPASGTVGIPRAGSPVVVTFSEQMNPATISASTIQLRDPAGAIVPSSVSYVGASHTATLTPTGTLAAAAIHTVRVVGGVSGVKDISANPLAADVTSLFVTAGAPGLGVTASGRYSDESADDATTSEVTTMATTNFVVYVHGEGGSPDFPAVTDTYSNTWTPQGIQQTHDWPGFLWVFTSTGASGGPGHAFTAAKPGGYLTILVVEVVGTSVSINGSAIGADSVSPFTTGQLSTTTDALLLGAFAPAFPDAFVNITPGNGFETLVEYTNPGSWVTSVATRTVPAGSYSASWTMTGQFEDLAFGVDQLVITGTPVTDSVWPAVTAMKPAGGSVAPIHTGVTVTFSERMDPASITTATVQLRDPLNAIVPATLVYEKGTRTARLSPVSPLTAGQNYTIRVVSGPAGVKDLASNPIPADATATFKAVNAPMVGASAFGRYSDEDSYWSEATVMTTQTSTNFLVFIHGEGDSSYPRVVDNYDNVWTPIAVRQTSAWPGYLWVFASLNAQGGPGHYIGTEKDNGYQTILAVEVVGSNLALNASALEADNVSPYATLSLSPSTPSLLLGAFAPGFPDMPLVLAPQNGFETVVDEARPGSWVATVASRTVEPGTYSASWLMTGGVTDFDYVLGLIGVSFAP